MIPWALCRVAGYRAALEAELGLSVVAPCQAAAAAAVGAVRLGC